MDRRAGNQEAFLIDAGPFHIHSHLSLAYSAQSERRFRLIVIRRRASAAEAADIGSGVHDDIGDGRIPSMT
jgi:hypothetical protein